MPATIPTKEHGGSRSTRVKIRRHEFRQLHRIQGKLERRWKTIEFTDEELKKISIVRGSPFDIDEDDPIDLDPRFVFPAQPRIWNMA
ncbi:hypothetical protein QQX98_000541 [Neonectria punicea]|uniref:Uncharacterized protein n=1 Tax=Neonectria punicea TaxID=979145 RepID=A0ABR1HSS0_9HYPO